VVQLGLPLLRTYAVPATLFICPGLIDTDQLHWWQAVERAGAAGLLEASTGEVLRTMKAATDPERRRAVAEIEASLAGVGGAIGQQLTSDQLREWLAAGNDLGNHSYDHPRLDRCSAEEQVRQVQAAHEWLTTFLGASPQLFAWPNGDAAEAALRELHELEYRAVLVCYHRLSVRTPMALSRLRIDADDSVARLRSVVSGAHPAVFGLQRRVQSLLRRG
jgi:peptidoglycan/xylan/chitin deacetylase (PgdA/CDA1 family)